MKRAGAARKASPEFQKLRGARAARVSKALFVLPKGRIPTSDAARRFWSERTWSEFAAVPAVSQVVLSLVRVGAPLEVLGAYTSIADDEVRHAMLSRELADAMGGYVDEIPEALDYAPTSLARPQDTALHVWAMANGCFSETVSLALIQARHAVTKHPVVRAVLAETLKDEAVHVRVAWELAEVLLPSLPSAERRAMGEYGEALAQMLRRTFGTSGLTGSIGRRERRLRDETASAGLGSLSADAENRVVDETLVRVFDRLEPLLR